MKKPRRRPPRLWTAADVKKLAQLYPHTRTADLEKVFGRDTAGIYRKANKMGIRKSSAFKQQLKKEAGERLKKYGDATRFPKGHVPANKGLRGFDAGGRSHETRFRKGNLPQTWVPVGSETTDSDGYLKRKVADTRKRTDWRFVHVLTWEEHSGREVPAGHVVVFRDGDRANLAPDNLDVISRKELMARNTIHNLPEELQSTIHALGRLKRVIRKTEENQ